MSLLLLIVGLVLFIGLVVIHEFGHFIAARRNGVEVEEFGIGFPPRARVLGRKHGTVYTLNWLPLGGFVRLKGEHDADTAKGSFGAASLMAKTKIMTAGVAMNLVTAFILLTFLALVGIPKIVDDQFTVASDTKIIKNDILIAYVEADSPAAKAGLEARQRLVAIGPTADSLEAVSAASLLPAITEKYAGQTVVVQYESNGELRQTSATLRSKEVVEDSRKTDDPVGYIGIVPTEYTLQRATWSAPIVSLGLIKQFTVLTFKGLGTAIAGIFQGDTTKASEQVSGPVGVFVLLKDGSVLGYQFIVLIIAVISLTLAIMNVLPIPALDGGRLFVTWLFRVIKKPLKQRTEDWIHGTGFALLMVLFVLITFIDIRRFF